MITWEKEGVISADRKLDRTRPPDPNPEAPAVEDADSEAGDEKAAAAPGRLPPSSDTCSICVGTSDL